MSTAAELIEEVAAAGASLHVDDGRLVARGVRLPEALLGRLRAAKGEVVVLLSLPSADSEHCRFCGRHIEPRSLHVIYDTGAPACLVCHEQAIVAGYWRRAELAVESVDAPSDEAEVMLRGEVD